jgi:hypothetical protein
MTTTWKKQHGRFFKQFLGLKLKKLPSIGIVAAA